MLRDPMLQPFGSFQDPVKSLTRYFLVSFSNQCLSLPFGSFQDGLVPVISLTRYFVVPFWVDIYSVLILLYNLEAVQEYGPESSICRVTVLKFFG